jgi:hypothetical protein
MNPLSPHYLVLIDDLVVSEFPSVHKAMDCVKEYKAEDSIKKIKIKYTISSVMLDTNNSIVLERIS